MSRHEELIAEIDSGHVQWGVKRLDAAVRTAYGARGVRRCTLAWLLLLLPTLCLAVFGIWTRRYGLLVWSAMALHGFRSGSPGPTGVGLIFCLLLAAVGFGISLQAGRWHLVGGILPGVTWFGACIIQGLTMQYLEDKLRRSPEYLEQLERDQNLVLIHKSQ